MEDNCFTMFCWFLPYSKVNLPRVLVAQLCLTLCDPMHCSPPGSSVRGILQTRILEWIAIPFSRGSTQGLNPGLLHCRQILYLLSHHVYISQRRVKVVNWEIKTPKNLPWIKWAWSTQTLFSALIVWSRPMFSCQLNDIQIEKGRI